MLLVTEDCERCSIRAAWRTAPASTTAVKLRSWLSLIATAPSGDRKNAIIPGKNCLDKRSLFRFVEAVQRPSHDGHQRRHAVRLLQPAQRLGGRGAPADFRVAVRGGEDAADAMPVE